MDWNVPMQFSRKVGSVIIKTPVFVPGQKAQPCALLIKLVYFIECVFCCMGKAISKSSV